MANALCWQRDLDGDFEELVAHSTLEEDITVLQPEDLIALELSEAGQKARAIILQDDAAPNHLWGLSHSSNLLKKYERDEAFEFSSHGMRDFLIHVDSSSIATADTSLCTDRGRLERSYCYCGCGTPE